MSPEDIDKSSVFVYDSRVNTRDMNREKLEMVAATLELLLVTLKEELKEPTELPYEEVASFINEEDVDEYYEEELDV